MVVLGGQGDGDVALARAMAARTKRKARKGSLLPRSKAKRRLAWMAVATGTAYAAAAITNTALSQGYKAVKGKQPPEDELARGTSWPVFSAR